MLKAAVDGVSLGGRDKSPKKAPAKKKPAKKATAKKKSVKRKARRVGHPPKPKKKRKKRAA